jgi:hypothetical protein
MLNTFLFSSTLAKYQYSFNRNKRFVLQEDLHNTTLPINNFRTEVELKTPFENNGEELGLQLLQIKTRPIKFCDNSKSITRNYGNVV